MLKILILVMNVLFRYYWYVEGIDVYENESLAVHMEYKTKGLNIHLIITISSNQELIDNKNIIINNIDFL